MSNVLTARNINSQTKLRLIKCYIWSNMLYGCETWTISEAMKKQLEAAEMWFLRRMMKISWIKKVTNQDVLRRALTERQLMKQIVKRQCSFLGHIVRKGGIECQVVTGKVEGKRDRKAKTDISWVVRQMPRQERSGNHSFSREQNFVSCCDIQCQTLTRHCTTTTMP